MCQCACVPVCLCSANANAAAAAREDWKGGERMIMLTAGGCPTCRERWLPGAEERLDLDFCVSAAAYGEGVHSISRCAHAYTCIIPPGWIGARRQAAACEIHTPGADPTQTRTHARTRARALAERARCNVAMSDRPPGAGAGFDERQRGWDRRRRGARARSWYRGRQGPANAGDLRLTLRPEVLER